MSLNIFLGWDSREEEAYKVASESILRRVIDTSVKITPLKLKELNILTRPIERENGRLWCPISNAPMSTEFAISRFCVPFLQDNGWALFCDSDILCLTNIKEIFDLANDKYAVMVVKHKHNPKQGIKMDNQVQTSYSRKNWSSVVLWNCGHKGNKRLTLEALNTWPGRDLHAFKWLKDSEIGELPKEWNWLVGEMEEVTENPKLLHFTNGVPPMPGYEFSDFSDLWWNERTSIDDF